jgi:hypothetical protein
MPSLALCTAIYPGVEPYLGDWYTSVLRQIDSDFQLWIGVDMLEVETVREALGGQVDAVFVKADAGDTPAQVRQRTLGQAVDRHDEVVLVDSDDLLRPSRVQTARDMLRTAELAGCALQFVDESGADLRCTFRLPPGATPEQAFPRNNVYGLSNSAYRSALLRRCLPIPAEVELVDWFLATRAWLIGAEMTFGERAEMEYRQHGTNMVRVRPPFSSDQVAEDTVRVLSHFRLVQEYATADGLPHRQAVLREAVVDVETFYERVVLEPIVLERYVEALNATTTFPLWWSSVAHQSLRHMWASTKEHV